MCLLWFQKEALEVSWVPPTLRVIARRRRAISEAVRPRQKFLLFRFRRELLSILLLGMNSNPVFIVITLLGAGYVFRLWWQDYQSRQRGQRQNNPLPGATPAGLKWVLMAIGGALVLVAVETFGEIRLGVSEEQSEVAAIMLIPFICAGFIEELIFRGFVFYDKKGVRVLWLSIVGASVVFALLHFQYYLEYPEDGGIWPNAIKVDAKSGWSLLLLLLNSLWFYYLRFASANTYKSLIPCFAAHIGSNVGVFVVKLAQGHVTGWF